MACRAAPRGGPHGGGRPCHVAPPSIERPLQKRPSHQSHVEPKHSLSVNRPGTFGQQRRFFSFGDAPEGRIEKSPMDGGWQVPHAIRTAPVAVIPATCGANLELMGGGSQPVEQQMMAAMSVEAV